MARQRALHWRGNGKEPIYLALIKHWPKLQLDPDEIQKRYNALDKAFDEHYKECQPFFQDLIKYAKTVGL
jgi:hypothetical protein